MLKIINGELKTPDGVQLLSGINLEITQGQFTYFHGPNGVGKTSLIKGILGLGGMKLSGITRKYQNYFYMPQIENKDFLLPLRIKDISSSGPFLSEEERMTLWNMASGGQRKKALIEKALVQDCDIYIFDEPYNHLDKKTIDSVNQSFLNLLDKKKTIIMIGHKLPEYDKLLKVDLSIWK